MIPFVLDQNYEVTENQEIYSHYLGRILSTKRKTYTKNNQYKKWYCAGTKKEYLLHRTVALAYDLITLDEFLDKNVLINHKNLDKLDNRPQNLEKITYSGNLKHYHKNKYTVNYLVKNCSIEVLEEALKMKKEQI